MAGGPASGEGVFDLNRIGLECGMRSTSKGDMSSERELGVGWFPSMGGNSRRVPSCPTNHPSTCALSVTAAALSGMAGDGGGPRLSLSFCVLGPVSHGHSVYISSAPESRSPSLHSRPKVTHLQRLMYVTAHLRNRASYRSQTEILLTIESWRRERSGAAGRSFFRESMEIASRIIRRSHASAPTHRCSL